MQVLRYIITAMVYRMTMKKSMAAMTLLALLTVPHGTWSLQSSKSFHLAQSRTDGSVLCATSTPSHKISLNDCPASYLQLPPQVRCGAQCILLKQLVTVSTTDLMSTTASFIFLHQPALNRRQVVSTLR